MRPPSCCTLAARLEDAILLENSDALDLYRVNVGHGCPQNSCDKEGDDEAKTAAYFDEVFCHRGDRRADWAAIYTQFSVEHSERCIPNRWDYTTEAELVRLNFCGHGRPLALVDLTPDASSSNETEDRQRPSEASTVTATCTTNLERIREYLARRCPLAEWRQGVVMVPLANGSGEAARHTSEELCQGLGECQRGLPLWALVATHPDLHMDDPSRSSAAKALHLKRIVDHTTVPVVWHGCGEGARSHPVGLKSSSRCSLEVLLEGSGLLRPRHGNAAPQPSSSSNDGYEGTHHRPVHSGMHGVPLMQRLGELGSVALVWDDEDSLECVIPHGMLVPRKHRDEEDDNDAGETKPISRLFSCLPLRRYWRHRSLPITAKSEDH